MDLGVEIEASNISVPYSRSALTNEMFLISNPPKEHSLNSKTKIARYTGDHSKYMIDIQDKWSS